MSKKRVNAMTCRNEFNPANTHFHTCNFDQLNKSFRLIIFNHLLLIQLFVSCNFELKAEEDVKLTGTATIEIVFLV